MKRVVITPRSLSTGDHPKLQELRDLGYELIFPRPGAQPSEEDLYSSLSDAVGYLAGVEKVTARVLESARNLKVISRNGTGVDNIDLACANRLGIKVLKAEGANARGVAELAMGHILSAARSIPQSDASLKRGLWERSKGFELAGKTLGLVGCGKIGKLVTGFSLAFGMKVAAYDPYPDRNFSPSPLFSFVDLDSVFFSADIISLHCPPLPDGKPLIDREAISRMKKDVVIVNTARAALFDEEAVLEALDSGRISAVTIDAFETEPPAYFRLVKHPRVIATPHIGGFTAESVDRATAVAVDNLIAGLREYGL